MTEDVRKHILTSSEDFFVFTIAGLQKATTAEEGSRIGLGATEGLVESHRLLAAALLKECLLELAGEVKIPYAILLEGCKCILVNHFRPKIAVVSGSIAAGEDMVEISRAIAGDDFVDQAHFFADLSLECIDVDTLDAGEFVPLHIKDGSRAEFTGGESLIELGSSNDLVHQLLRDDFSGLVMTGILGEKFGLEGPVLIELREGLHEIAGYRGAAD